MVETITQAILEDVDRELNTVHMNLVTMLHIHVVDDSSRQAMVDMVERIEALGVQKGRLEQ